QLRRFRLAHQELIIESLHQERDPREPALDPDGFELRETLGNSVQDPVRHVHQIAPHEAERMHAEEAVYGRERRVLPVITGVKRERLAEVLDRSIEPHIGVVVDRLVVGAGDAEYDYAPLVAELPDGTDGLL